MLIVFALNTSGFFKEIYSVPSSELMKAANSYK